jgi:hypothetical protein
MEPSVLCFLLVFETAILAGLFVVNGVWAPDWRVPHLYLIAPRHIGAIVMGAVFFASGAGVAEKSRRIVSYAYTFFLFVNLFGDGFAAVCQYLIYNGKIDALGLDKVGLSVSPTLSSFPLPSPGSVSLTDPQIDPEHPAVEWSKIALLGALSIVTFFYCCAVVFDTDVLESYRPLVSWAQQQQYQPQQQSQYSTTRSVQLVQASQATTAMPLVQTNVYSAATAPQTMQLAPQTVYRQVQQPPTTLIFAAGNL